MNQPPNQPPGGFGPPSGYGPPPPPQGAPMLAPPPPAPGRWVTPLMVVAGPGNVAWLAGVVFFASSVGPKRELVAAVCAALIPHAAFTTLFATLLMKARPTWSRATRIVAGSYLTSGLSGMIGVVLSVFAVGLLAAACGGCRR